MQVDARLRDLKRALDEVPRNSPEWASMKEAGMVLDVQGWRFRCLIEQSGPGGIEMLVVDGATRID